MDLVSIWLVVSLLVAALVGATVVLALLAGVRLSWRDALFLAALPAAWPVAAAGVLVYELGRLWKGV